MYAYTNRKKFGAGPIFFMILFLLVFAGAVWLYYSDRGRFWDYLPFICIPAVIINLILLIFYFSKRNFSAIVFTIFFIIFIAGIIISSLFGPFSLYNNAVSAYDNKNFPESIRNYEAILNDYPGSKYAKDSARAIPYAYYFNEDYQGAVFYFDKAFESGFIDPEDFEIKKILSESHSKLGDIYYKSKNYINAAENYIKAVGFYSEIFKNFPDTNEAFISQYRIPEFLYKAALSYKDAKSWENANNALVSLISGHPESEYYKKGNDLIFNIIILKSYDLKNQGKNDEIIIEFLKVFDLPEEITGQRKGRIQNLSNQLFSGMDVNLLVKVGDNKYTAGEFEKAYFIYNYIFNNFPGSEEIIVNNFVDSKIKVVSLTGFKELVKNDPVGNIRTEGFSSILFENKTDFGLIIFLAGPRYNIIKIDKLSSLEIELPSGNYTVVSELLGSGALPLFGETVYEEGKRYREIYQAPEEQ